MMHVMMFLVNADVFSALINKKVHFQLKLCCKHYVLYYTICSSPIYATVSFQSTPTLCVAILKHVVTYVLCCRLRKLCNISLLLLFLRCARPAMMKYPNLYETNWNKI